MSYDANGHTTQMAMLRYLLLAPSAGFAQLQKAADVTSDYANFHIQQLIGVGYLHKAADGQYRLTQAGKEYANRMDTDSNVLEKQAKLAVLLLIENKDGKFLAQKRLKQPYFGFWGRASGKIRWGETVLEAAARELAEETDLTADLEFKGIYHKMDYKKSDGSLLEDKYFYLVYGKNPKGELLRKFEGGENEWLSHAELDAKEKVFASAGETAELVKRPGQVFIETRHEYNDDEY